MIIKCMMAEYYLSESLPAPAHTLYCDATHSLRMGGHHAGLSCGRLLLASRSVDRAALILLEQPTDKLSDTFDGSPGGCWERMFWAISYSQSVPGPGIVTGTPR